MKIIGALERANIIIYKESSEEKIECSINPSQYVIRNTANYTENTAMGSDVSNMLFLSGSTSELSLTLYFDSASDNTTMGLLSNMAAGSTIMLPPVTDKTSKIKQAIRVDGQQHQPPYVGFQWGNLNFKGVITSITETFTMFSPFGKPVRSKMDLSFKEVIDPSLKKQSSPFESPDRTKCKILVEGMSLWSIAQEEYGDCEKWRVIAKANNLMTPLDIQAGQVIRVPAI